MKKILLPFLISVFSLALSAETISGYTPFHEYFMKQHGNLQKLGSNRNIIYNEIAYSHDTYVAAAGSWTPADSGLFNYSQDANQVWQINGLYLSFVNPNWDTTSRVLDSVSSNGFLQAVTGQNLNSSIWTNSYQYAYTYYTTAPVGYLNTETLKTYAGGNWLDSITYTYSYDSIGRRTKTIVQIGNALQNDSQYLYTYTGWNITNVITQAWVGSAWVNVSNQYNSYDANNNNTQSTGYLWNGTSWVVNSQTTSSYSATNQLQAYYYYLWSPTANGGLGGYVNNYYESYQYVLGDNTQFQNFYWDTTTNTWTPSLSIAYSFDGNNNVVYEQDQTFANGAFGNTDLYFYYYNAYAVSGINDVRNDLSASIFPNPTYGNITFISLTTGATGNITLSIYDAQGKVLKHQKIATNVGTNQISLNTGGLASGNYYVQVTDETGKASVLKFVKQ